MTHPSELRRPPSDSGKLLPDLLALHPLSSRKFGIIRINERYADILLGALDVRNEAINHHQPSLSRAELRLGKPRRSFAEAKAGLKKDCLCSTAFICFLTVRHARIIMLV